jgi:superoxide dismutase, Fe-Mn family
MAQLADLPYAFDALEPHIDARTMQIHHGKHHAAYVTNLNAALASSPDLAAMDVEALLRGFDALPAAVQTAVRNNGGGHHNHELFWSIMSSAGGGAPSGDLAAAIAATFGSYEAFQATFADNAMKRFGSGWSWLVVDGQGALHAYSTANQDSPLMSGHTPILGLDVWEHAYYLHYQNRRADYVAAFWHVVDWSAVAARYAAARG